MYGRLRGSVGPARSRAALASVRSGSLRRCGGVAMVELMVALLVFSTGMLGLFAAQLGGKRAGYDALQRSVATALAGDILERVRANPGHAPLYAVAIAADGAQPPPVPEADCDSLACTGAQLAAFDVWHWRKRLLGAAEAGDAIDAPDRSGSLRSPRACITATDGMVEVAITWRAMSRAGAPQSPACGTDIEPRQQLVLSTFVGGA